MGDFTSRWLRFAMLPPRVGQFQPGAGPCSPIPHTPPHIDESTPMTPVPTTDYMDSVANGPVESSASAESAAVRTKGRGLRRWRRIPRDYQREGSPAAGGSCAAQLHKRRLPLGTDTRAPPKGRHEVAVEEDVSSVESRFVPLVRAPPELDPDLGLLVASAGFSVGADSDNSEDYSSRSSTTASAPRHDFSPYTRERDRARSLHLPGKNPRTARARANRLRACTAFSSAEAENSRSSLESDLHSSNAINVRKLGVGAAGNGTYKALSDGDNHSDDGQPSEEARPRAGGHHKENGSSVMGKSFRGSGDSDDTDVEGTLDEGSVGNSGNELLMNSDVDAYTKSILLLQRTQEALENEIQKFVVVRKESSDICAVHNDKWSNSVHLEESVEEASYKVKDLQSRMEEASALIKEKDLRILELEALSWRRAWRSAIQSTDMMLLQPDLDKLLQEKMEGEIQCIILTRASQTWTPLVKDKMDLYEELKTLYGDYKQLEVKLRRTENRATMLGEMAVQLEAQCQELSASSEILQLQSRASTLSLFCFIQFILLFIAVGTFVMRLLQSATDIVPT